MAAKTKKSKPRKAGRPAGERQRAIAIKVSDPVYLFLERLGDGIPGRGLRILAERAAEAESNVDWKAL